jgi:hypothetical protein
MTIVKEGRNSAPFFIFPFLKEIKTKYPQSRYNKDVKMRRSSNLKADIAKI